MIIQDTIQIKVNNNMKQYYIDKGYQCSTGDIIAVKNSDLPDNSHVEESRICDNCKQVYTRSHRAMVQTFNSYGEDVCTDCVKTTKYRQINLEKQKQTNLEKYGVEHNSQLESNKEKIRQTSLVKYGVEWFSKSQEVKDKARETCLQKYGTEATSQIEEVKAKIVETNLKKYGYKTTLQNPEVKNKAIQTCLEKYGVENVSLSKEIQQKRVQTFLERYNCENPGQIEEVKIKIRNTMYQNGTVPTSSQQIAIKEMIEQLYPDKRIELNYPESKCSLDIVLFYNEELLIDIEYDGWYWHKNKKDKDYARDKFLKSQGYKILRIRSGEILPTLEELRGGIESLIHSELKFKEIILSDWEDE